LLSVGLTTEVKGKTLIFRDTVATDEVTMGNADASIPRSLLESAMDYNEHTIKSFLNRPLQVFSNLWTTSQTFGSRIGTMVLPDLPISQYEFYTKMQGFMAFKATTVVRLVCNPTRFQQGRLLMSYFPRASDAANKYNETATNAIFFSQLPNVQFDCAKDSEVILRIPFNSTQLYYDLATGANSWGNVDIFVYNSLFATAGHLSAQLTVYVHFEDIDLQFATVPTVAQPQAGGVTARRVPKSREIAEEERKPDDQAVSSWLTSSSRLANFVGARVPLVSPLMSTASWALNIAASTAQAWGWSKPLIFPSVTNVHNKLMPYAINADGEDNSYNYGLLRDNHIDVLPGFGGTNQDDMSLSAILSTPAYYTTFTFSNTQVAGTNIWTNAVCPQAYGFTQTITISTINYEKYFTAPMTYFSQFFSLFRGSVGFRFKFVKTEFHTGKLQFAFFPRRYNNFAAIPVDYASTMFAHREIVDLRETSEYTFVCKYASTWPYLPINWVNEVGALQSWNFATQYGTLQVNVVNELVAPDNVSNSIGIIVEVFAAPDFEFAGLVGSPFVPYFSAVAPSPSTGQSNIPQPVFQAGDVTPTKTDGQDVPLSGETALGGGQGGLIADDLDPSRFCIGERILSIRQMLKRFTPWLLWSPNATSTQVDLNIIPWVTIAISPAVTAAPIPIVGSSYNPDLYDALVPLFAYWRGSVRLKHTSLSPSISCIRTSLISIGDQLVGNFPQYGFPTYSITGKDGEFGCMPFTVTNPNYNCNEVNIPYVASSYCSAVSVHVNGDITPLNTGATSLPSFIARIRYVDTGTTLPSPALITSRAIGEDFHLGLFTGTVPFTRARAGVPATQTTTTKW
jgi:hypothetical protein